MRSGYCEGVEQRSDCLSSYVRNAPSLTTFRRELKTILFRSSVDNDWAIVIVHSITVVCSRLLTVGASVRFVLLV